MLTVGLNRAVTLIEEKRAKGPRKGRFGADPGRALGDHPDKGGPIVVKNGRYGPYVSHDGVNATLPSDMTPEAITLEQAVGLLDARAARGPQEAAGQAAQHRAQGAGQTESRRRRREAARQTGKARRASPGDSDPSSAIRGNAQVRERVF